MAQCKSQSKLKWLKSPLLKKILLRQDDGLDWIATLQEAGIHLEISEQHCVDAAHCEMDELIVKSA